MLMLRTLTSSTMGSNTLYYYPHPCLVMEMEMEMYMETDSVTNMMVSKDTVALALHEVLNNKNLFPRGESA